MTKIGLVGCGMWGRNLARNLAQLDVLLAVADHNDEMLLNALHNFTAKNVNLMQFWLTALMALSLPHLHQVMKGWQLQR